MVFGVEIPILELGPVRMAPFAVMLAGGILCGQYAMRSRARTTGLDPAKANVMFAWMIWFAFVGSLAWRVADNPARFWDVPELWGSVFEEMSSLPAMMAGTLGAVAFLSWAGAGLVDWFRYLDCAAWAFPFGWVPARLGCALTHGHIGRGGLDVALVEAVAAVLLAGVFALLRITPAAPGFFVGIVLLVLGSLRLAIQDGGGWQFTLLEVAAGGTLVRGRWVANTGGLR